MPRRHINQEGFAAYTSRGGLLPAATLRRVVDQPDTMPAGGAEGYELPPKAKLDEHIDRAWHDARAYWNDFKARAGDAALIDANGEPATGRPGDPALAKLTRDRLALPLLNLLDWHDLEARPRGIEGAPDRLDPEGNRMRWPATHEAVKHQVPVHILGYDVPLDRRSRGAPGAHRQSPHSTVQDLLNGSDRHLWAIATNGAQLRLLRDSSALTRQAYAEFDLRRILDDGIFTDFVALWLLVHATRFAVPDTHDATTADMPIERLQRAAVDDGIRALDHLRDGVQAAIQALGTGLLTHPRNQPLRDALDTGELSTQDFYNEVLRTIYRLVFLFAVEDRDLLHPPNADPAAVAIYREHYATQRLREQARRHRGGRHGDGWRHYQTLVTALREGQPALAVPPVAGWLWSTDAAPHVDACHLDNRSLYTALRHLTTIEQDKALHRVSYKHLGADELGSVYEALLELVPRSDGRTFRLVDVAGNARKTTGSYYTPTTLIARILDDALDPVITRVLKHATADLSANASDADRRAAREGALLDLRVCDPAMGSAHFLVAAAHRLAKRLAEIRTGDLEPDPADVQDALREIVSHCVYGVDLNPMAVELAKVALWLECHVPGTPLTFLDHHLKCGNALLGAGLDPVLLHWRPQDRKHQGGVPDAAFKPVHGDDRNAARRLRDLNRTRRQGEASLLASGHSPDPSPSNLAEHAIRVAAIDDRTPEGLAEKQSAHRRQNLDEQLVRERLRANAWIASWTIPKTSEQAQLDDQPFDVYYDCHYELPDGRRPGVIQTCAENNRHVFFHWYLEFPEIADAGGFDCLIGNPPWGTGGIDEPGWFRARGRPEIAEAKNAMQRRQMIETLAGSNDPVDVSLIADYSLAHRTVDAVAELIRESGRFPLRPSKLELSSVFANLFLDHLGPTGKSGFLCREVVATGKSNQAFISHVVSSGQLEAFYLFENESKIFPSVHNDFKFAIAVFTGTSRQASNVRLTGFIQQPDQIDDSERLYVLTSDEISAINPHTRTVPIFRRAHDAHVTAAIHRGTPVLCPGGEDDPGPWGFHYPRLFNIYDNQDPFTPVDELEVRVSRGHFIAADGTRVLPMYEAKMIWLYDHRYGTYAGQTSAQANKGVLPHLTAGQHDNPSFLITPTHWTTPDHVAAVVPDHWCADWLVGVRDKGTKERTMLISVIPLAATDHPLPVLLPRHGNARQIAFLIGALSSLPCDYAIRQKSLRMFKYVVQQAPVPPPPSEDQPLPWGSGRLLKFVVPRVVELAYTAWDVEGFAVDCGLGGAPFRWNPERRALLQAELDAMFFHSYGLDRAETEWVLDSFGNLRDVESRCPTAGGHGEFRTKRLVLERYDVMAQADGVGSTYTTVLEPPPSDDSIRHPA